MNLILQEDSHGCALACLAMVSGQTYQAVKAGFSNCIRYVGDVDKIDFTKDGIDWGWCDDYLISRGFYVARKFMYDGPNGGHRTPWPCVPFAPIHICSVSTGRYGHSVVMLANGTLLDPNNGIAKSLAEFKEVYSVAGYISQREAELV